MNMLSMHPQEFVAYLRQEGINRLHFVPDKQGQIRASHTQLQAIADFIQNDKRDYLRHEGIFLQISAQHETLQGAFVHKTVRGQGAGGVRYWQYDTVEDYLRDGLRLAKGMTRKNALAGIWWGGGKGVMAQNPAVERADPDVREALYKSYGDLVTATRGCYVTAEDVGTNVKDMANIFSRTRFTTCIPGDLGGSGNPSIPTARGVVCGMEAALHHTANETLAGKVVAVQGAGNVGGPLIDFLLEKGVEKIIAADIDADLIRKLQARLATDKLEAKLVKRGDNSILAAECDIVAPCATGATLNPLTIPQIKAKIICGAANNQLEDAERDDILLHERGICYVPDFLTNRMGIVNCANEQYGFVAEDPFIEKHLSKDWEFSVHQTALKVLKQSGSTGEPPAKVAIRMADQLSEQPHPIFGHRGQDIIDSLIRDRWFEQTNQ